MTLSDFAMLIIGIILGAFVVYFVSQWVQNRKKALPQEAAPFTEQEAEQLLKNQGYKILDKMLKASIITQVDGRSRMGIAPADFLVERDRKVFIVHVHGGSVSADPGDPALRRKFIESNSVYQPDGLLLLDMVDKSIQEISFEFPKIRASFAEGIFRLVQVVFIMGIILGIIWLMVYIKLF